MRCAHLIHLLLLFDLFLLIDHDDVGINMILLMLTGSYVLISRSPHDLLSLCCVGESESSGTD